MTECYICSTNENLFECQFCTFSFCKQCLYDYNIKHKTCKCLCPMCNNKYNTLIKRLIYENDYYEIVINHDKDKYNKKLPLFRTYYKFFKHMKTYHYTLYVEYKSNKNLQNVFVHYTNLLTNKPSITKFIISNIYHILKTVNVENLSIDELYEKYYNTIKIFSLYDNKLANIKQIFDNVKSKRCNESYIELCIKFIKECITTNNFNENLIHNIEEQILLNSINNNYIDEVYTFIRNYIYINISEPDKNIFDDILLNKYNNNNNVYIIHKLTYKTCTCKRGFIIYNEHNKEYICNKCNTISHVNAYSNKDIVTHYIKCPYCKHNTLINVNQNDNAICTSCNNIFNYYHYSLNNKQYITLYNNYIHSYDNIKQKMLYSCYKHIISKHTLKCKIEYLMQLHATHTYTIEQQLNNITLLFDILRYKNNNYILMLDKNINKTTYDIILSFMKQLNFINKHCTKYTHQYFTMSNNEVKQQILNSINESEYNYILYDNKFDKIFNAITSNINYVTQFKDIINI